jgi:3-oxoacyl-[acyl-carrier protein] reductase
VITYSNDSAKANKLIQSMSGEGHLAIQADVQNSDSLKALAETINKHFGALDLLVNCAGVTTPVKHNDLDALSDEWIDKIFQVNVRGAFAAIRAVKPLLEKRENATVINISSVAGITGIGSNVAYCASKAALDSMTRSLARALAPKIRVVSVSPGWVLGEYASRFSPEYIEAQVDATPLKKTVHTRRCGRDGLGSPHQIDNDDGQHRAGGWGTSTGGMKRVSAQLAYNMIG